MYQPPKLIQDATDRYKLEISLPGGRYQLSLDDRAVNVLINDAGFDVRDAIPEPFVPFFVAMGDAWFPSEQDTGGVIEDLRMEGSLNSAEREALVDYVTESLIPEAKEKTVRSVIEASPIADEVDPTELQINELPEIPEWSGLADTEPEETVQQTDASEEKSLDKVSILETLQSIRGIGPDRAKLFFEAGVTSLSDIADSRPVELAAINGISEGIAAVAIEGARELLGEAPAANKRLATETGTDEKVFEAAINQLAASGVPASEAEPTLRVLYGPTVADIEAVTGQQAYYLWEAGYQTPYDIVEASDTELTDIYQIGSKTVSEIRTDAKELVGVDSN